MTVTVDLTPNPNARKFTVGVSLGAPTTYRAGDTADDPIATILAVPGVTNVFTTSDFVTVSKRPETDWDDIQPAVLQALVDHFD